MQKNKVITLGLLAMAAFGLSTANAGVKLVLDESKPLGMVGDTSYDLDNNIIEITLDRPVLCNQAPGYQTGSLTKLRIYDPNLEMKGGFGVTDGIYFNNDADYMVNNGQLFLNTDNPAKALCVSAEVGNYDLIYKDPFEFVSPSTAHIHYVGLPNIVAPGQVLDYEIHFTNPSGQTIYFDLLEYWNDHYSHPANMTSGDNVRVCNNNSPNVQCVVNDPASGVIKGIQLASGGTFILEVTQKVSESSTIGAELDFMAAVFLTNGLNGDFLPRSFSEDPMPNDPHVVSQTVTVATNTLPELSWDVAPGSVTSFYEDESTPQVFEIRYSDAETSSQELDVSVTDNFGNIVNVTEGPFVIDGLDGTKTLSLLPVANAFTDSGNPEQITVTVTDAAAGEASLTFDVDVEPVNDAPTFAMNCSELTVNEQAIDMTCTSPITQNAQNGTEGVWGDQYIIADFNPGPNESHQSVLDYEINVVDDGGILDMGGNGNPVWISPTTGEISVVTLTGQYGTAEVEIRVIDDGGTTGSNGCGASPANPEHGCDVSGWESLTIVSEAPVYTLSGIINGLPQGSFVNMNLQDAGNGDAFVENENKTNATGNNPLAFSFDYEAADQFNYKVVVDGQSNGLNCDIESASGTEPNVDTTVGTVNGANVTDLVVTCVAD
jgi:hypothetical protein